jgi:GxxExxY protein
MMNKGLEKHLELTEQIIAACYEVHKTLGPGLEEKFYRDALAYELELRGIPCAREQEFLVEYKSKPLGLHRVDLVVDGKVVVELKAVTGQLSNTFVAQTLSERKVSKLPVALLVNFGEASLQLRRLESRD